MLSSPGWCTQTLADFLWFHYVSLQVSGRYTKCREKREREREREKRRGGGERRTNKEDL